MKTFNRPAHATKLLEPQRQRQHHGGGGAGGGSATLFLYGLMLGLKKNGKLSTFGG